MESGHMSGTDSHQVATPSENSQASLDKKLTSHSRSSSEVAQLGTTGTSTSNAGVTVEEFQVSSMSNNGRSDDGSATPIPPTQATERPAGGSLSDNSDRIPSHVFSRTITTGPAEWSVASNESLFSIHMGNMSFTREQLSLMYKSGELGYTSDSTFSGPLAIVPSNNQTPRESTESTKKSGNLNKGQFGVTEAAAAETMREVLREKESQHKDNISPHSRSLSQHSDASVKSFAFPILTDHADKYGSMRKSTKNKKQVSRPSTPSETPKALTPPETPKPHSPSKTPKPDIHKSQTPNTTPNARPKGWFSCFSCCPSSS
ncbi:hypothetical protein REPUB_Repub07fG0046500 [Reevesia pubescens]